MQPGDIPTFAIPSIYFLPSPCVCSIKKKVFHMIFSEAHNDAKVWDGASPRACLLVPFLWLALVVGARYCGAS
jgi:hypothetical protein